MSVPTSRQAQSNGRSAKAPGGLPAKPQRKRWTPIERLLPEATLTALRRHATGTEITSQLVRDLDRRWEITERYGLSRRRLRNFLRREHERNGTGTDTSPTALSAVDKSTEGDAMSEGHSAAAGHTIPGDRPRADGKAKADPWRDRVHAHRRRQRSVAAILDRTFGRWANSSPDLWEHRAYLMLIGLVYERLATSEDEVSTDELTKLAKALAENRRAHARREKDTPGEGSRDASAHPTGELPDHFAEVVRRVYGTNLQPQRD